VGYNPREHVCELFDFECMRKNSNKIGMYRIIILSCSLPEKKDEPGVLAIFFFQKTRKKNVYDGDRKS
jgi:hypothetical protein